MSEEFTKMTIGAISMKNSSIMNADGDIWYRLDEAAAKYLNTFKKGDNVNVKLEDNKIVWIKKLDGQGNYTPKSTATTTSTHTSTFTGNTDVQDMILAQSTLKEAVQLVGFVLRTKNLEEENINIIDLVKTTHKELYKYMKDGGYK